MAQASTLGFTAFAAWAAEGEPVEVIWPGLDWAVLVSEVPEEVFTCDCVVEEDLHEPKAANKRHKESIGIRRISTLLKQRIESVEQANSCTALCSSQAFRFCMVYHYKTALEKNLSRCGPGTGLAQSKMKKATKVTFSMNRVIEPYGYNAATPLTRLKSL
jgi:hypothetical protein